MFLWRFFIFSISLMLALQSFAQKDTLSSNDSLKRTLISVKPFATKKKRIKTFDTLTFRAGFDLIGTGQRLITNKFALHLNTDLAFRNKNLVVSEFTWASRKDVQKATYFAQASILRLGWMHNFLHKQSKIDVFAIGLRFANAWYKEEMQTTLQNSIFGTEPVAFRQNLQASWIELNMELKAKIWKNLLMGYCLRYQFKPDVRGEQIFESYGIPSIGRTGRNNWGFQYGIWWFLGKK
ncbi:hypothetical protein Rain11_1833 [Raineya orbicola]|uniref:DUF2490 domain-containing protein n=2 Tax=Raineya orbicola TaxID=2016530 RepID=A0A2N3ICF7_9BACT|nr:hypothetical protein Rain11_1833 [Raineya orbicola]